MWGISVHLSKLTVHIFRQKTNLSVTLRSRRALILTSRLRTRSLVRHLHQVVFRRNRTRYEFSLNANLNRGLVSHPKANTLPTGNFTSLRFTSMRHLNVAARTSRSTTRIALRSRPIFAPHPNSVRNFILPRRVMLGMMTRRVLANRITHRSRIQEYHQPWYMDRSRPQGDSQFNQTPDISRPYRRSDSEGYHTTPVTFSS